MHLTYDFFGSSSEPPCWAQRFLLGLDLTVFRLGPKVPAGFPQKAARLS